MEENMEKILFSALGLIFGVLFTVVIVILISKLKEKKSDDIIERAKIEIVGVQ